MNSSRLPINIVWFKRDLRLRDHEPLLLAQKAGLPVLMLYIFEPSVMAAPQYDERHWRFVSQSLEDLNRQLLSFGVKILVYESEVLPVFAQLLSHFSIQTIYSYQETGLKITYDRDKAVTHFCKKQNINWQESVANGVVRGLRNRKAWRESWYDFMAAPLAKVDWENWKQADVSNLKVPDIAPKKLHPNFQPGGESYAHAYLKDFLNNRIRNYAKSISKPLESRRGCSRLSPYIAWGCLSVRQVWQAAAQSHAAHGRKFQHAAFASRLRWQAHFIQKFESEDRMEFENVNRGYDALEKKTDPILFDSWKQGQTGIPLVDACMRCLIATGWVNFRMRAMLASCLTHLLWQPWQPGAEWLAKLFLDFEPGIHYPQWQMQSGVTGINTVRIYNPVKQGQDNDPKGIFVKQWVPELRNVPENFIHEPWKMSAMEQQLYGVALGKDYPTPVVDIKAAHRFAREKLWSMRSDNAVKKENSRILKRHTLPDREAWASTQG
ncbi:MAG: deoxyribodipyrimidine photolyase [Bacteroidetes bacterium]|nr:deoxyribodipyrimidine photolyase [Bacteroidota bacterium]